MSLPLDDLDRLAAIHVMDWHSDGIYWKDSEDDYVRWGETITTWQPTRNIAQAWECLRKLKPYKVRVEYELSGWSCRLTFDDQEGQSFPTFWAAADSGAPEAIVRACLRVRGIDIGGVEV